MVRSNCFDDRIKPVTYVLIGQVPAPGLPHQKILFKNERTKETYFKFLSLITPVIKKKGTITRNYFNAALTLKKRSDF